MFQIDEKVIADSRTLITIQHRKDAIDPLTKNGTIHYAMDQQCLWLTNPKVKTSYLKREDYHDRLDRIILARDGMNIDGSFSFDDDIAFKSNVEIQKDLVVKGNFTVEGKTSIIDTPRLSIEDNIIELNRNENGQGITLRKAGTAINRGVKGFARNLYDETYKAFVFDTNQDMDGTVDSDKWVAMAFTEKTGDNVAGDFKVKYRVVSPFAKFTDSITVMNTSNLNHILVDGNSKLNGPLIANNSVTINGTTTINGQTELNNLLTVNRVSTFNDNVVMRQSLNVDGVSTLNEEAIFNKGIKINSLGATIVGNVAITGELSATERARFNKDLSVGAKTFTGALSVGDLTETALLNVKRDATVSNNLKVGKGLTVNGTATIDDITTINGEFYASSKSNFSGDVAINNKNVTITSNEDNNGILNVGGNATFHKDVTIQGRTILNGQVNIDNGPISMPNADIIARNVTVNKNYKVASGDDHGILFWNDDMYKIYMASSLSSVGGRLDSTSDYNMYFRMGSGTNRGFVFKNSSTALAQIEGNGQVRVKEKIIAHGYDVLTRENEGHKNDANGINADKLDNLHATDFLRRNVPTDTTSTIEFKTSGQAIKFDGGGQIYKDDAVIIRSSNATNHGVKIQSENAIDLLTVKDDNKLGLLYKDKKVWHEYNQGHDSGLDADTLDGEHKEYFATSTHLHDNRYIRNDEVNLKGKYKIEYNEDFDALDFMYMGDTP